jgi:putative hydrolase of the HAD superfamily
MAKLPDGTEIRVLLLDLDDTILDNRSGVRAAWDFVSELLAAPNGLRAEAVRAEIDRVTDWFWSDSERHRTGRLDLLAARRTILGRALDALDVDDPTLVDRAAAAYQEHRSSTLCLEERALETLGALRARVGGLGLVTNGASDAQRAKIDRFDLWRWFDHVQIEGELGVGKPEVDAYLHATRSLGAAPEETLMAGDDFECDVLGSLGAGLHAAWIDAHGRGRPRRPAPRDFHVLSSIRELLDLLEG